MKVSPPFAAAALLLSSSCASIVTGSTDTILVQSVPSGAYFSTNLGVRGRTPQVVTVPASQDLVVSYKLRGYEPTSKVVESRISGWILGNALFGGLIGLGLDLVNPDSRTHDDSVLVTLARLPEDARAHEVGDGARQHQLDASLRDAPPPTLPTEINIPANRRSW